jgi:hypothetical protein
MRTRGVADPARHVARQAGRITELLDSIARSLAEGGPHRQQRHRTPCEIRALPGLVGQHHDENQREHGCE